MTYLIGVMMGLILRPFLDIAIKIFRNAWIKYKKQ
jgi:hypothetical protein